MFNRLHWELRCGAGVSRWVIDIQLWPLRLTFASSYVSLLLMRRKFDFIPIPELRVLNRGVLSDAGPESMGRN